mgnify:CR=1 FL=1
MADILKGNEVVTALNKELSEKVVSLKKEGIFPRLAIVRIGDKDSDISYEKGAIKRCEAIGVSVLPVKLEEDITQIELEDNIKKLNQDKSVHGILIFRPLPKHLDENKICDMLLMDKDVDGITKGSLAGVFTDSNDGFPPCTAEACVELLKYYGVNVAGKNVVIVGRSLVVGKPLSMMLLKQNATVTICHSKTKDLPKVCSNADILIVAVGSANMVNEQYVSAGQVVIDVGINMDQEGNLCGDVSYPNVSKIVKAITPVPGGVGSVTTSILAGHTINAAMRQGGM